MNRFGVLPAQAALGRKLSVALAREASLAFDQAPLLTRTGEIQCSDLRDIDALTIGQLSHTARVCVSSIDQFPVLALAALARSGLLIDEPRLFPLGFRDIRTVDGMDVSALKGVLDFNFDRAVDLFVEETVWQDGSARPSTGYLESRFLERGHVSLLVVTLEHEPARIGVTGNVGDNFGVHIVRHLSRVPIRPFNFQTQPTKSAMFSVGSSLEFARDRGLVWGTGFMGKHPVNGQSRHCGSIFLGVRGPRSREEIIRQYAINPPVIGDPGLLIREVVVADQRPQRRIGFVVHKVDKPFFKIHWPDVFQIENQRSPQELVRDILSCSAIVSTSLHGLIFAHALGVPAAVIKVGDRLVGGEFKFTDYCQSIGQYAFSTRPDLSDAPRLSETDWFKLVDATWQPEKPPGVSQLLRAFPFPKSKYH